MNDIANYGLAGLVVLLAFRTVQEFIKERKNAKPRDTAADKSTEFWQIEIRHAMKDSMADMLLPVLEAQTSILKDIREELRRR